MPAIRMVTRERMIITTPVSSSNDCHPSSMSIGATVGIHSRSEVLSASALTVGFAASRGAPPVRYALRPWRDENPGRHGCRSRIPDGADYLRGRYQIGQ